MTEEEAKQVAWAAIAPKNIGELRKAIEFMRDDLTIFSFEYGDLEGRCRWKRNQSWRQWCRAQKEGK